mgnify:FL=1|tara:strand:+ start:576 stop:752 length:177 start_codon:yes stop_codon:yes gene_type:complete
MIINLNAYRHARSKEAELEVYNSELKNNLLQKQQIDTNIAVIEDIIKIIEKEIEEEQE